jgi:transglutaminase-like putative cysteine protease
MPPSAPEDLSRIIETLYRSESGRILATLVRLLGDLDLAEEAMPEAFAAALDKWPQAGIPDNPRPGNSLPGASVAGIIGAVGNCPPGRISDLQRGILG